MAMPIYVTDPIIYIETKVEGRNLIHDILSNYSDQNYSCVPAY